MCFFFQAEDGIRDHCVTGVQTCALPISQILVTNLDEWIPRQVVGAYQRRWPVEQINRELKTDLGLGEHQVSKDERRIEIGRASCRERVKKWVDCVVVAQQSRESGSEGER